MFGFADTTCTTLPGKQETDHDQGLEPAWIVRPRDGLGDLRFGMSPDEVDAHSGTYGPVTGRRSDGVSDDVLTETLAMFGADLSDEERRAIFAAVAESRTGADSVTETRGEPGLVLRYENNRLVEIMLATAAVPLFFAGGDVFALGALDALGRMEQLNGGPGRYAGSQAAFDALAVSLEGFCFMDDEAGVCPLDGTDDRFNQRTVTLRLSPYQPESEADQFVVRSVVA